MSWDVVIAPLVSGLIGGAAAGVAAIAAIRVHLQWLRRDIDRAHARLDRHDEQHAGA